MNQRPNPIRLAALAAALLCVVPAPPAPAQRRPRPTAPAPARRPESAPEARATPPRRAEPERSFEELLPAEGYGLYVEVRRVGSIFEMGEVKTAFAAARLVDADFAEFAELFDFVQAHAELLAEARILVAALPARPGLPQGIVGLQLPTPEAAAAFEPKYRALLTDGAKSLGLTPPAPPPTRAPRGRAGARRSPQTRTLASRVVVRRVGQWLLGSDKQFNPARLRAESGPSLAESQRFQSLRNRFSSEQVFVYFDINRTQEAWAIIRQQEAEERARVEAAAASAPGSATGVETDVVLSPVPRAVVTGKTPTRTETADLPPPAPEVTVATPPTEGEAGARAGEEEAGEGQPEEGEPGPEGELSVVEPVRPSEEQVAAMGMERLLRNMWGGVPRIPNAAALAVGLEGGTLAVRVAVENPGGGPVNLIPFLPNIISGAPVTTEAAQVAPADGGIFISGSLDWPRIFDALMGTAKENAERVRVAVTAAGLEGGEPAGAGAENPNPTAEETLAQVEKFFGFKLREDFVPTLGNEVAVSLPLDDFTRSYRINPKTEGEAGEKDAGPGLVALVALNDPEKAARLLPRVLTMLGVSPIFGAGGVAVERREGFEIHNTGGLAYGIVNNFLVLGQLEQVRHVADEAAAHRTLAATGGYREATAWQARQKLVQAYVSEGLMRHTIEESKRQAAGSADPVVLAMLTQLEAQPEAASLASTTDGDLVLHELRLPLNLIKVFGASAMIGAKEAPVIGNEMSAAFMLSSIRSAQTNFRSKEGRARYGTLEELVAEGLLDEEFAGPRSMYAVELTALGDRFEATATPRQYGKTGRRSFFLDESGIIRAADHKGKPATAQDPPVD